MVRWDGFWLCCTISLCQIWCWGSYQVRFFPSDNNHNLMKLDFIDESHNVICFVSLDCHTQFYLKTWTIKSKAPLVILVSCLAGLDFTSITTTKSKKTNCTEIHLCYLIVLNDLFLSVFRSLSFEWAKYGMRMNIIAPGPFETEVSYYFSFFYISLFIYVENFLT